MSAQLTLVAKNLTQDIYADMKSQNDQSVKNLIHTKQLLAKARQDQIQLWKEQAYTESAMIATTEQRTTITSIQEKRKEHKIHKTDFCSVTGVIQIGTFQRNYKFDYTVTRRSRTDNNNSRP